MSGQNPAPSQTPPASVVARFRKHWFVELLALCATVALGTTTLCWYQLVQPRIQDVERLRKEIELRNSDLDNLRKERSLRPQAERGTTAQPPRLSLKSPIITFGDQPVPSDRPGWQGVIVTVQPPPRSEDKVQVWIKQGDENWYPCNPAEQVSTAVPNSWMAMCRFGNPDSQRSQDKATPGTYFTLGAFCWKEEITNTPGLPVSVVNAFQFKLQESQRIEYRGK
jgi:hypothetical protein